ncbi:hypothetical protein [Pleionea litopenaei]|uniref:Uncharacterized protein n=1 Tax=Pleionea litopenaei TaxID=3070815 RepID=A0AA51RWN4_9GAMM|nr:hypothetical protein [Pleionea sp. HL-JVS1]WMS88813.1 hypothetical protein Q9312_07815 [Pleionea sp. HL-JVS1]
MGRIKVEGLSVAEILEWPIEYFDELVLIDDPIVLSIGTAQVLGQFSVSSENRLVVELAQIDGGGEGVLPTITRLSKHIARIKAISEIECIVYAVNCAEPNLKLRAYLVKAGFELKNIPRKGEVYYKVLVLN